MLFALCGKRQRGVHLMKICVLTESLIQHVQCHLIAFLRASNSDQTLVAVILWFVNLDDAATKLTNLIDFRSAFTNDSANHVVWNINLLRQWLAWHGSTHGLGCSMRALLWHLLMAICLGRLRPSTRVGIPRRTGPKV